MKDVFDIDRINCLIDLHLHLDGALSLKTIKELASLKGMDLPNDEEIIKRISISDNCKDLNEYLEKFAFPIELLDSKKAIEIAVYNLLEEAKEQGVIYAEVKIGPTEWSKDNLTAEEVVQGAIDGLNRASIKAGLISCCMRGNSKEVNMINLELAKKYLDKGVVAVDLAGAEALFPNEDYDYVFEYAEENNIPFTIHAGEADGPKSVYSALEFKPFRIGHGVRSVEDEELLDILKEKDIILELCPTSNIDTNVFDNISEFPLRTFLDKGIKVTINSDDPVISKTSLRKEWKKVIIEFNLTKEEVKSMLFNSVEAAFLNNQDKNDLVKKIEADFSNI